MKSFTFAQNESAIITVDLNINMLILVLEYAYEDRTEHRYPIKIIDGAFYWFEKEIWQHWTDPVIYEYYDLYLLDEAIEEMLTT